MMGGSGQNTELSMSRQMRRRLERENAKLRQKQKTCCACQAANDTVDDNMKLCAMCRAKLVKRGVLVTDDKRWFIKDE